MPMYTYRCDAGHTFEQRGKMDGSDAPKACTHASWARHEPMEGTVNGVTFKEVCIAPVQKVLSAPARVFPGADSWRR